MGWKLGEYFVSFVKLSQTVDALKEQNERLEKKVLEQQRVIDFHAGQLQILTAFVHRSLQETTTRPGASPPEETAQLTNTAQRKPSRRKSTGRQTKTTTKPQE